MLLGALAAGDTARLSTIPGIGKRTADRLVLELKDRVQELAAGVPTTARTAEGEDLVQALVNLGYKRTEAEPALARAQQDNPDAAFHELLRAALQSLARI